jgi:hypothetical protein
MESTKAFWLRPLALKLLALAIGMAGVGVCVMNVRQTESRRRAAAVPPPVSSGPSDTSVEFGPASVVPGTDVLRVDLVRFGGVLSYESSYRGGELRNILFIDPDAKEGRWLLPDAQHVIDWAPIEESTAPNTKRVVVYAAVVKPVGKDGFVEGRLIVFDPTGVVVGVDCGRRPQDPHREVGSWRWAVPHVRTRTQVRPGDRRSQDAQAAERRSSRNTEPEVVDWLSNRRRCRMFYDRAA